MAIEITMPALSPTMEAGTLAKWLVKEGDLVSVGDVIAEIETDKATMEVESVDEGRVVSILIDEGAEDVAVGTLIARLVEDGQDLEAAAEDASMPASDIQTDTPAINGTDIPKPSPAVTMPESVAPESVSAESVAPESVAASPAVTSTAADPVPDGDIRSLTVREALRDAMAEEMRRDDDVFVVGEEVAEYQGAYKVTQGLLDEFGADRVIDTPITEHGFAGLGVGAAFSGLKPVVEFMTFNFAMQAIDHIINSAAKTRYMSGGLVSCPIVFRGPNGAASRVAAQHSQNYAAWYANVPGLIVIAPYCAADAKGLLKAAIRDPNPVVFLENELMYGSSFDVPDDADHVLPIGRARVRRSGADVTIVSYSITVGEAMKAAETLAAEGLDAEVIDLRTIRPLDMATIVESVKKTNRCVVAEEGWPQCSVASDISARLMEEAFDWLDAPVTRVNSVDVPLPYAENLEKAAIVTADKIMAAVKAVAYVTP